jgi:hypothetical protein
MARLTAKIRGRIGYANVVATIALFASLTAGAYAAFHLGPNTVNSRNIVNGSITSRDFQGHTGALAYARVISNGSIDPRHSRKVAKVKKTDSGFYCIAVSVPIHNVVASGNAVTFDTIAEGGLVGSTLDSGLSCPKGSDAYVETFDAETGQLGDRPFYVLFN